MSAVGLLLFLLAINIVPFLIIWRIIFVGLFKMINYLFYNG